MPGKAQGAQLITSAFPAPDGSLRPVSISRTPASADYTNGITKIRFRFQLRLQ